MKTLRPLSFLFYKHTIYRNFSHENNDFFYTSHLSSNDFPPMHHNSFTSSALITIDSPKNKAIRLRQPKTTNKINDKII